MVLRSIQLCINVQNATITSFLNNWFACGTCSGSNVNACIRSLQRTYFQCLWWRHCVEEQQNRTSLHHRIFLKAYIRSKSRTDQNWPRGSPRHTWLGPHFQGQRSRSPGRFGWLFKSSHNSFRRHVCHRPESPLARGGGILWRPRAQIVIIIITVPQSGLFELLYQRSTRKSLQNVVTM